MEVLRLPLIGGFYVRTHKACRYYGYLGPEGTTMRGLTVISRGPEGFKRANPQRSKGIKSRTLKGGAALSSGNVGIIPGPEGLTYTPGTN